MRPRLIVTGAVLATAVAAVLVFSVPLVAVFLVGMVLLCPMLMTGTHGGRNPTHEGAGPTENANRS